MRPTTIPARAAGRRAGDLHVRTSSDRVMRRVDAPFVRTTWRPRPFEASADAGIKRVGHAMGQYVCRYGRLCPRAGWLPRSDVVRLHLGVPWPAEFPSRTPWTEAEAEAERPPNPRVLLGRSALRRSTPRKRHQDRPSHVVEPGGAGHPLRLHAGSASDALYQGRNSSHELASICNQLLSHPARLVPSKTSETPRTAHLAVA
jgi:hypothetical protein